MCTLKQRAVAYILPVHILPVLSGVIEGHKRRIYTEGSQRKVSASVNVLSKQESSIYNQHVVTDLCDVV